MFIETDLNSIIETLSKLNPLDKPEWGSMSAQRMVEHLTDTVYLSFKEHSFKLQLPNDKIERAQKFILTSYSLPKNFQAAFANGNNSIRNNSLEDAIIEFEESWMEMIHFFKKNPDHKSLHPHFGDLNSELWLKLHSKHFTHHFIQFNLIKQ